MLSGHDDVVEEAKPNQPGRRAEFVRRSKVFRARGRVARRMVVSDGERPTVMAKHRMEDLPHWKEGAVDGSLTYGNDPPEVIRAIADEHDRSLAGGAPELVHRDGSNVGRRAQARWGGVAGSKSGQAEGGDQSRRLFWSDARESGELLRPGPPEPRDASKVPGESPRRLQAVLPSLAALQDERDELLRAERVDSTAGQTVMRVIEGYAGLQREKSCTRRLRSSGTNVRQLRHNRRHITPRSSATWSGGEQPALSLASALAGGDAFAVEPAGDLGEAASLCALAVDAREDVRWERRLAA